MARVIHRCLYLWSSVDGCVWAREIDPDHLYPNCSQMTTGLPYPSNPAQIIVTWTGTSAANLACSIQVN